jgi:hypothetical protein
MPVLSMLGLGVPVAPQSVRLSSGLVIEIPKTKIEFNLWHGSPIKSTWNHKAVLNVDGEPVFAELAVVRLLARKALDAVWVSSKFRCDFPPSCHELPARPQSIFDQIVRANAGKRAGCWDVLAWDNREVFFIECKRRGRDQIRPSQAEWLAAALSSGLLPSAFLILEWTCREEPKLMKVL